MFALKKTVKLKSFSLIRINNPPSQQKLGTKLIKQKMKNFGWLETSHIVNLEESRFCFSQIESVQGTPTITHNLFIELNGTWSLKT